MPSGKSGQRPRRATRLRQPRLADAAGTGQRDEPDSVAAEQRPHRSNFARPTNDVSGRGNAGPAPLARSVAAVPVPCWSLSRRGRHRQPSRVDCRAEPAGIIACAALAPSHDSWLSMPLWTRRAGDITGPSPRSEMMAGTQRRRRQVQARTG